MAFSVGSSADLAGGSTCGIEGDIGVERDLSSSCLNTCESQREKTIVLIVKNYNTMVRQIESIRQKVFTLDRESQEGFSPKSDSKLRKIEKFMLEKEGNNCLSSVTGLICLKKYCDKAIAAMDVIHGKIEELKCSDVCISNIKDVPTGEFSVGSISTETLSAEDTSVRCLSDGTEKVCSWEDIPRIGKAKDSSKFFMQNISHWEDIMTVKEWSRPAVKTARHISRLYEILSALSVKNSEYWSLLESR